MKLKKTPALLLCALLLLSTLAGCLKTNTDTDAGTDPVISYNVPELSESLEDEINNDIGIEYDIGADGFIGPVYEHTHGIDFEAAMAAFSPDTIMISADDIILTWADLYVILFRCVNNLMVYPILGVNWSKEDEEGRILADTALEYATEEALSYMAIEYGAKVNKITPDTVKLRVFQANLDRRYAMFYGEAYFEQLVLSPDGFYDFDVYKRFLTHDYLLDLIMDDLYGEYLFDFPEERVAEYARRERYMFAKHILRLKTGDNDKNPRAEIEDILRHLRVYRSAYYFVDVFSGMMHEYSDDYDKLVSFPYGILFQHGDMAAPFSNTCASLRIGQLSGIVETDYGYHIILRRPIDYDIVPLALADSDTPYTLRQLAVQENFEKVLLGWRESLDPEYSPEFTSLDLSSIFKMCEH